MLRLNLDKIRAVDLPSAQTLQDIYTLNNASFNQDNEPDQYNNNEKRYNEIQENMSVHLEFIVCGSAIETERKSLRNDGRYIFDLDNIDCYIDGAIYETSKVAIELYLSKTDSEDKILIMHGLFVLSKIFPMESFSETLESIEIFLSSASDESIHNDLSCSVIFDGLLLVARVEGGHLEYYDSELNEENDIEAEITTSDSNAKQLFEPTNRRTSIYNNKILSSPSEIYREVLSKSSISTVKLNKILSLLESSKTGTFSYNGNDIDGKNSNPGFNYIQESSLRLDDEDVKALVFAIHSTRTPIESLSLKYNNITNIGLEYISNYLIEQNPFETNLNDKNDRTGQLLYLDLQGNEITNLESLKLHNSNINNLKYLNISNNFLGETGGLQLASSLGTNRKLKSLIANHCNFTLKAMIGIVTNICGNKVLEELEIDKPLLLANTIQGQLSNHLSRVLLEKSTRLCKLSLRWCSIQDNCVRLLTDSICRSCHVESLNLECNQICVAGCEALASCIILQHRKKMHDLLNNHGYNDFNAIDYYNEGESMPSQSTRKGSNLPKRYIQDIKLSYNCVGDEGAIALAEAIEISTSIKRLTLKNNGIGPKGLIALGNALKKCESLEYISLFGNHFNQESGEIFYHIVKDVLPMKGIEVDIDVYIVDGVYMVAQN